MKNKQWVQHISGQGEKWEVLSEESRHWRTKDGDIFMWLPKSEYRLCDPPEMWKDVTEFVQVVSRGEYSNLVYNGENVRVDNGGYRLRKVRLWTQDDERQWAFIVEKKD